MSSNIGLVFYKTLFEKHLKFINLKPDFKPSPQRLKEELFDLPLVKAVLNGDTCLTNKCLHFELTTIYPGLLLGSGYAHEIGGEKVNGKPTVENELKLGFFFDYTTGLPCIPGSSIKGVLRSAFEKNQGRYVVYILHELKDGKRDSKVKELATAFDEQLLVFQDTGKIDKFGNKIYSNSKFVKTIFEGGNLPVYQHDIFFDAFPIHSANQGNIFIGNDYITPHDHPLKNPNPIQFLKVLPGVSFRFDFKLTDSIMPKKLKLEVFRQILLDLGIGAKTNVGYGQFDEMIVNATSPPPIYPPENPAPENIIPANIIPSLIRNATFPGEVLDRIGLYNIYTFKIGQTECRLKKQYDKNPELKKGDKVTILFKLDYQNGTPNFQVK